MTNKRFRNDSEIPKRYRGDNPILNNRAENDRSEEFWLAKQEKEKTILITGIQLVTAAMALQLMLAKLRGGSTKRFGITSTIS